MDSWAISGRWGSGISSGRFPSTQDTIWRIYSMTKPITGVALMSLYERGMFQLNDPVSRFIPQWRDLKVKQRSADGSSSLSTRNAR